MDFRFARLFCSTVSLDPPGASEYNINQRTIKVGVWVGAWVTRNDPVQSEMFRRPQVRSLVQERSRLGSARGRGNMLSGLRQPRCG